MNEGLLPYIIHAFYELEVKYVNYANPRPALVDLFGEENQSCPVLVLEDGTFINETKEIIRHLTEKHQIGYSH